MKKKITRGHSSMSMYRSNFWERNALWLVTAIVSLLGYAAVFAVTADRVTTLEERSKEFVVSSQHKDLERRVESLETEVVPRSEHLLRDEDLNKRLDGIQSSITSLQTQMNSVQTQLNGIENRQKVGH